MSDIFLIIGASSDVGVSLIEELNKSVKDAKILAHYNSSDEAFSDIPKCNGNEIIPLQCDLRDSIAINKFIEEVNKVGIPKGIVHLPAPKLEYIKFKDLLWQECEEEMMIQVRSAFVILQAFLPRMIKTDDMSKVVFMLSENTVNEPAKFSAKYTMSKYMLLGLMKSLTTEYAGKRVNINAISPSMIDTKFLSNIDRRMLEISGVADKMLNPREVAKHMIILLSGESDDMYGENILMTEEFL